MQMRTDPRGGEFNPNDSNNTPDHIKTPRDNDFETGEVNNKVFDPQTRDPFFNVNTLAQQRSNPNVYFKAEPNCVQNENHVPLYAFDDLKLAEKRRQKESFFSRIFGLCRSKKQKKGPSPAVSIPMPQSTDARDESFVLQSKKNYVDPEQAMTEKDPTDISQFDPNLMSRQNQKKGQTFKSYPSHTQIAKDPRSHVVDDLPYTKYIESYYPSVVNNRLRPPQLPTIEESGIYTPQIPRD